MAKRTCSIPGCNRPHEARGWCNAHYLQWRQTGEIKPTLIRRYDSARGCQVEGCELQHYAKDLCHRHYARQRKTGRLDLPNREEVFWSKVNKTETCWLWTDALQSGYGMSSIAPGLAIPAHRYAYQLLIGPIPEGLTLDHLCRVRNCVNPAHLEPVTRGENVLRGVGFAGVNARKTHCIHGHPFDEENTYLRRGRDGEPRWRQCKTCCRIRLGRPA
jgi:hypothetical protein